MFNITPREIWWAAAFIDGEGSVICRLQWSYTDGKKRKQYPVLRVFAWQKDRELLDRLSLYLGGSVYKIKHNGGHDFHQWNAGGAAAAGIIMTLYPIFSSKRQRESRKALGLWRSTISKQMITHWRTKMAHASV